jgi:O-antigen ligase
MRWAFVFLAFSCCSLLWTSTVSLPAAIAYWCAMAADVAIVILMLRAGRLTEVAHSLMKGYVWGACAVAIIAWLLPAQSDLRLGDEELLGPNAIGYLCAFALFFAQYLVREKDGKWGAPAILLGLTLLRSLSKTTIIAFLAGEVFLLVRDKSMLRRTKVLLTLGAVAMVVAFSSLLSSYYDIYTNAGNQAETLTGRLGLWTYFLAEAVQQPWVGHGFHSVWRVVPPFGADQFEARHAHNELLQQFYAYGMVGGCMFVGIYGSLWLQLRQLTAGPKKTFFFAFLLFVLVRGLADTDAFDLSLPLWSIVLISMLTNHECATSHDIAELPSHSRPHSLGPVQRV